MTDLDHAGTNGNYGSPEEIRSTHDDNMRHALMCRETLVGCRACEDIKTRIACDLPHIGGLSGAMRAWMRRPDPPTIARPSTRTEES